MTELNFTLSQPIKDAHVGGDVREVTELVLNSPPAYCKNLPIQMRQIFSSCMMKLANGRKEERSVSQQEADLDGESVIQMLYMADANMEKMHDIFKKLLILQKAGVCKMDGEAELTKVSYDGINASDMDRLLGEYLANFMVPSWMPKDTKK